MPLPRSLAWSLCLIGLCAAPPFAWSAQHASKSAHTSPAANKALMVSLLGGKLHFSLPASYKSTPLPPGEASTGTAGAHGTLYMNEGERRIVVTTEMPIQRGAGGAPDEDANFLANASEGFVNRQAQGVPDFHKTAEQRVSLGGLPAEQIDATASIGGGRTLTTYFITGVGKQMAVVQLISRESDPAGHNAMIKRMLGGVRK
jgi:hypothetical protein